MIARDRYQNLVLRGSIKSPIFAFRTLARQMITGTLRKLILNLVPYEDIFTSYTNKGFEEAF
jgi:hypothetical protein